MAQDEESDSKVVMLMATTNIKSSNDTSFYLDPGCSTHTTRKEEWFISLNDLSQTRVGLVDLAVSSQKALAETKMAKANLLSLGHLLHKEFVMTMQDNCLKMFDKNHKLVNSKSISELNFSDWNEYSEASKFCYSKE